MVRSKKSRVADIIAGGLIAALCISMFGSTARQMTAEEALAAIDHLIDAETKQLVTAHLRRRACEIAVALAKLAEGDDNAGHEARAALRELQELTK